MLKQSNDWNKSTEKRKKKEYYIQRLLASLNNLTVNNELFTITSLRNYDRYSIFFSFCKFYSEDGFCPKRFADYLTEDRA